MSSQRAPAEHRPQSNQITRVLAESRQFLNDIREIMKENEQAYAYDAATIHLNALLRMAKSYNESEQTLSDQTLEQFAYVLDRSIEAFEAWTDVQEQFTTLISAEEKAVVKFTTCLEHDSGEENFKKMLARHDAFRQFKKALTHKLLEMKGFEERIKQDLEQTQHILPKDDWAKFEVVIDRMWDEATAARKGKGIGQEGYEVDRMFDKATATKKGEDQEGDEVEVGSVPGWCRLF